MAKTDELTTHGSNKGQSVVEFLLVTPVVFGILLFVVGIAWLRASELWFERCLHLSVLCKAQNQLSNHCRTRGRECIERALPRADSLDFDIQGDRFTPIATARWVLKTPLYNFSLHRKAHLQVARPQFWEHL